MVKAVIFDLDGTIADTLPLCIAAFRKSIEPLAGRSLSDEEIIATFGPSEEGTVRQLVPEHFDKGLADYLQHYTDMHDMCPTPFDGMVEIIEQLRAKEIIVGMVTGKGKPSCDISLKYYGLENCFDAVETGPPTGPRKPEGIAAILDKFSLKTDEVVYIGDQVSDIVASRAAGVPIIAAGWGTTADIDALRENKPDALFDTVGEFREYILGMVE